MNPHQQMRCLWSLVVINALIWVGLKIRTSEMYEFPTGMNSFPTHIQVIHFETLHIAETACFILFTLPLQCKHPIPLAFGMS